MDNTDNLISQFIVAASAPRLTKDVVCAILCLWNGAYKRVAHVMAATGFLFRYSLQYIRRHITVCSASLIETVPSFINKPLNR